MRNTPQRLRSIAPPTRDKIILWSAVIAGCGILALLGRSAAIHRFNTDVFTGNVLFAVFLVLLIGLYLVVQNTLEKILSSIFRKNQSVVVAEAVTGKHIAIASDETTMVFATSDDTAVCDIKIEESPAADTEISPEEPLFEVLEEDECGKMIQFRDGTQAHVGHDMSVEEIMAEKSCHENNAQYEYDEVERAFHEYIDSLSTQEREDKENGITRIKCLPENNPDAGCFTSYPESRTIHNSDGTTIIEEWEEPVYLTVDGGVYSVNELDEIIGFYEKHKDKQEIFEQHEICKTAHEEYQEEEKKYTLTQIAFICAYLTNSLASHIEPDQLSLLHQNARRWTSNAVTPLLPVKLREGHKLSTDDLKHIGYNIGKFLKLNGKVIARFVKVVFPNDFKKLGFGTIEAKLCARNPEKDTIPIYMGDEMEKLFAHFQRYGNINLKILEK